MNVTDVYVNFVRERKSPQVEIIGCLLDDLNQKSSLAEDKTFNYAVSSKKLQKDFKERTGKALSQIVIGRTIKAFLKYYGLEEGKDYEIIKGSARKYLLEEIDKSKIKEMNKFRDVTALL